MSIDRPTKSPIFYDHRSRVGQRKRSIWRDFHTLRNGQLCPATRCWLLDSGSLTQSLIRQSNGDFAVHVIAQSWQRASFEDQSILGVGNHHRCLVREVTLLCHNEPWIYARSVLPHTSLTGKLRRLRRFDNRSLGDMLFTTPGMRRSLFQVGQTCITALPDEAGIDDDFAKERIWARRSRFELHSAPLLVSEFFLPCYQPPAT